jgi:hypothetical protein
VLHVHPSFCVFSLTVFAPLVDARRCVFVQGKKVKVKKSGKKDKGNPGGADGQAKDTLPQVAGGAALASALLPTAGVLAVESKGLGAAPDAPTAAPGQPEYCVCAWCAGEDAASDAAAPGRLRVVPGTSLPIASTADGVCDLQPWRLQAGWIVEKGSAGPTVAKLPSLVPLPNAERRGSAALTAAQEVMWHLGMPLSPETREEWFKGLTPESLATVRQYCVSASVSVREVRTAASGRVALRARHGNACRRVCVWQSAPQLRTHVPVWISPYAAASAAPRAAPRARACACWPRALVQGFSFPAAPALAGRRRFPLPPRACPSHIWPTAD